MIYGRLLAIYRRLRNVVRFSGRNISIGSGSWVSGKAALRVCGGGSISIGRNCEIHPYAMILTYGGEVVIADNCSLNPFAIIYGHGGVRLGEGVRIAAQSIIVPSNHNVVADGEPMHLAGYTAEGVDIGDHVWLGAGVRILDGVSIGRNAVVAAGGVVTKSVPENTTVGGVPARDIPRRKHQ